MPLQRPRTRSLLSSGGKSALQCPATTFQVASGGELAIVCPPG